MTADPALLSRAGRQRLLERLADEDERELDRLAALMRQVPDQLPPPVPRPLQAMARDRKDATERITS